MNALRLREGFEAGEFEARTGLEAGALTGSLEGLLMRNLLEKVRATGARARASVS